MLSIDLRRQPRQFGKIELQNGSGVSDWLASRQSWRLGDGDANILVRERVTFRIGTGGRDYSTTVASPLGHGFVRYSRLSGGSGNKKAV